MMIGSLPYYRVQKIRPYSMSILALINNKGGVGKTTTAIHLADGVSRKGKNVLLVDLDAQASASLALGCERDNLEPSIGTILYEDVPADKAIREAPGADVDLLTGSESLKNADVRLAGEYGRERLLDDALSPLRNEYDLILLDCPPSLSLLPVNAIVASDYFIVPVEPHYLALEGIGSLLDTIDSVREGIGTAAELLGVVVTRADFRAKATEQIIELLREEHGEAVFDSVVRGNVRVSEATSFGVTVFEHAPSSTGANAYRDLSEEVLNRLD
jgi:chromosome partitioning protein